MIPLCQSTEGTTQSTCTHHHQLLMCPEEHLHGAVVESKQGSQAQHLAKGREQTGLNTAWGSPEGRRQAHGATQRGLGNRRHYVFDSKSLTRGKAARLRVSVPSHTGHGDSHERLDETQKLR